MQKTLFVVFAFLACSVCGTLFGIYSDYETEEIELVTVDPYTTNLTTVSPIEGITSYFWLVGVGMVSPAGDFFEQNGEDGALLKLDLNTNEVVELPKKPDFLYCMVWNSNTNMILGYYVGDLYDSILSIDPNTGDSTTLISHLPSLGTNGCAFDSANNLLYYVQGYYNYSTPMLVTTNLDTLEQTSLPLDATFLDIQYDEDDKVMYGVAHTDAQYDASVVRVDTTTGAIKELTYIPDTEDDMPWLIAFDYDQDYYYYMSYSSDFSAIHMYTISVSENVGQVTSKVYESPSSPLSSLLDMQYSSVTPAFASSN